MGLETSAESPAPLREISALIGQWIGRMGQVWVEGQIAEMTRRPGVCFLTMRDNEANVSVSLTMHSSVLDASPTPIVEGARVVVHAQPRFYVPSGSFSLNASEIRPVGEGDLLARLERLKQALAAEGLFDPRQKKPLPFLPQRIGLITGKGSAAEKDVIENARLRWPEVVFEVRHSLVQGAEAARGVVNALKELDDIPEVDVIIIARGGGSLEDLLPFSDEALVRAVAAAKTPIVSAIGHEPDIPLIDLAADLRASTPTDAAKRVVPDVAEQRKLIDDLFSRASAAVRRRVQIEVDSNTLTRDRLRTAMDFRVTSAQDAVASALTHLRALSPMTTMERGYAVLLNEKGAVVRSVVEVKAGDKLDVQLIDGKVHVTAGEGEANG